MIKLRKPLKILVLSILGFCFVLMSCSKNSDTANNVNDTSHVKPVDTSHTTPPNDTTHNADTAHTGTPPINWKVTNDSVYIGSVNTNTDKIEFSGTPGHVANFTSGGNYTIAFGFPTGTAKITRTATEADIELSNLIAKGSTDYDPEKNPHVIITDSTAGTIKNLYFKNSSSIGNGTIGFVGDNIPTNDNNLLSFKKLKQKALTYTF